MTSARLYLRLLGYIKPYWRIFALSVLSMAVTAATEPLLPALLKPMLDGTFVHKDDTQRGFSIKGVDLFENRFVAGNFWLFRWLIPTRTVVVSERDSSSYFGAGKMVPGTDHFSIAKPSGVDHPSHQYLMEWWQRAGW